MRKRRRCCNGWAIYPSPIAAFGEGWEWGERLKEKEETRRERAMAVPGGNDLHQGDEVAQRIGVSMDGGKVHIRDEGWKELKVGCVFEMGVWPTWDEESKEWVELAHAVGNSYVAHLGGPERFGQMLWAEAQARGWERAVDSEVIGDGAPRIWNLAGEHFYDSQQVVDWYHATEHLAAIATLLHGEGSVAAQRWYNWAKAILYQGHARTDCLGIERSGRGSP